MFMASILTNHGGAAVELFKNSDFFGDTWWVVSEFQRGLESFNSNVLTMSEDLN